MNGLKQRLLTNWHSARIMRAGIGAMMLVMAIQSRDWVIGLFSVFFLYQGITDTGCCSAQGCYAYGKGKGKEKEDIAPLTQIIDEHKNTN